MNTIIITDVHGRLNNVLSLLKKYPEYKFVCLGDIVSLHDKENKSNSKIVKLFIERRIPSILGNHDEFVASTYIKYKITLDEALFLRNLPITKNIYFGNQVYKLFHYRPNDYWSQDYGDLELDYDTFCERYGFKDDCDGIIIGHLHKNFKVTYPYCRRDFYGIGALKDGNYAILSNKGISFEKL